MDGTEHEVIFIIEDSDDHFAALVRLLRRSSFSGWAVERASTLAEAAEKLRTLRPVLVLCDQALPDSDADETLQAVLELVGDGAAVVAMTSLDNPELATEVLRAGAQDYLVKGDHNHRMLDRALRNALDRRHLLGQLRQTNDELESFARIVSHDLKTPLAVIMLELEDLRGGREEVPERVSRAAGSIAEQCHAMRQIIDSLLGFARAGWTVGGGCDVVLPEECAGAAGKQLNGQITASGAELKIGPMPAVLASERALTQIFQNLIGNAIKYNDSERPCVQVSGVREGDVVRLRVQDNGVGIEASHREGVFEMFTRFDRSDRDGTGLGLAIVRRLAHLQNGSVRVESEPGAGSLFEVTLPAATEPDTE